MSLSVMSRRDLEFNLFEWLRAEGLCERDRFSEHSKESFLAALDACKNLGEELFLPIYQDGSIAQPAVKDGTIDYPKELVTAMQAFSSSGLVAATQDFSTGGMQLPNLIEKAALTYLLGSNINVAGHALLSAHVANAIQRWGSAEQISEYVKPLFDGRYSGTLCFSEIEAGSSLTDIKTYAEPQSDGTYRLFGEKVWVTVGDHKINENIVHLVLAKVPDTQGVITAGIAGISLFIVPKFYKTTPDDEWRLNDIAISKLYKKMGLNGLAHCQLKFGSGTQQSHSPNGAVAYLLGSLNRGMSCLFQMGNESRVVVSLAAVSLGYRSYLYALDYAKLRRQGRRLGARENNGQQVPIITHADVKRMLLKQKIFVEGGLGLVLMCAKLSDEIRTADESDVRSQSALMLEILTPITKSWTSKYCVEASDLAIEIMGSAGYSSEFPIEQLSRDNRVNVVQEGTHAIQALDLLYRKVGMQDGAALEALGGAIHKTLAKAALYPEFSLYIKSLARVLQRLASVTQQLRAIPDTSLSLCNATVYLDVFGNTVVGWIWLEQAIVAIENFTSKDADFYNGKLAACGAFYNWILPNVHQQLDVLSQIDRTAYDMNENWF